MHPIMEYLNKVASKVDKENLAKLLMDNKMDEAKLLAAKQVAIQEVKFDLLKLIKEDEKGNNG